MPWQSLSIKTRNHVGAICIALCCLSSLMSLVAACGNSPSSRTPKTYPHFKGIYQFKGEDNSSDAHTHNPNLQGANITFYWAQLEPEQGKYNWPLIAERMKPWTDAHKKVILRVSTAGWTSWSRRDDSGHGTPSWVYKLGVPSVTQRDRSIIPQYWNPIFLQNFREFVSQFGQKYDGNPNIAFDQIGLGIGGEAKVDSHNNSDMLQRWQHINYTDDAWWSATQAIITDYTSSFHKTPLAIMPDKTFIGGTKNVSVLLQYAIDHHIWLQENGLTPQTVHKSVWWSKTTTIEEQREAASKHRHPLRDDIQKALDLGASYILVFTSDIDDPNNADTLKWAASLQNTPQ